MVFAFWRELIFVDVLASGTGPGGGDWFKSGYRYRDGGSITQLGADKVRVKWPNDLYLQDRKLAGILWS
ncbi:bifunctional protein [includes: biotin operon repressor; biotin-[acetyl-CoA-carboxylase]synthetase] [Escherichia coli]|uniref:Bifunctional protein [includes: biotin operon repressor biotin-[acetyl-CoA-carboxylase]synthetase] n=1 Tax=Escherichia coli TaxID=562 RepID=A0A376WBT2_ECOLX|nr:bifunctional protein [includes: biotin operon repressor; biotin-[acetyl-CoA-carboxylase]synthetase] [Escherichia coli]